MVSRTQLLIVTAIVALGLLGPMSFIAQSAAKNETASHPAAAPSAQPRAPVILTPVVRYSASVTGTVVSVQPTLLVVLSSNLTAGNLTAALSNFTNATLTSLQPQAGHYVATYSLNSTDSLFNVMFGLSKKPVSILQYGLPAEVSLPPAFTAYRDGRAYNITIGASDQISGIVTRTQSGKANFTLDIVETGDKKKIVAVEAD